MASTATATATATAPLTAARTRDDDFILTLSDHDLHDYSSDAAELDGSEHSRSDKGVGETVWPPSLPKKRKRSQGKDGIDNDSDGDLTARGGKRNRSRKPSGRSLHHEQGEGGEDDGDDDGALNPGFDFQVPGVMIIDEEAGFDAWSFGRERDVPAHGKTGSDASRGGPDIDEIVRRRRTAKGESVMQANSLQDGAGGSETMREQQAEAGGYEDDEDENEQDWGGLANLDHDDVLAPDEFGAGALDEEDDQQGEMNEHPSIDEDDGSSDQDDDSAVASPTAHPDDDDVASTASESGTSIEDPEEASKRAAFFAPESDDSHVTKKRDSASTLSASFQSFSLSRPLLKGLSVLRFTRPTPIQQKTIPVALLGKDVVGSAVTGSGKTAAFLLPILERLLYRPRKIPTTRVAILMPTRELAVQCHAVAIKLASYTDITFAPLVGGFSLREQETVLKKRPDVVVATPGRFIDHMRNSASFTIVDTLEILVLDEADRMLQDGFAAELNEIIASIPKSRQTMLFSATMTADVDSLIRVGLNKPVRLLVDRQASTVATLTQEFVRLRPGREGKRLAYLVYLCKNIHPSRTIIFLREKKTAHRIRIVFSLLDLKAGELHGSMTQEQRIAAVEAFRAGKTDFLLATDLASRGLDIRGVETVINFEAPASHDIYLHRVGRTARAGRSGRACTLAAEPDRKVVKAAVKAAAAQGAKVVSRAVDAGEADLWAKQLEELDAEVEEVLAEEKRERQLAQVEREVKRADNLIEHRDEIMARPRRTWFESEREKKTQKRAGHGAGGNGKDKGGEESGKSSKKKLSGKEKKRLDSRRERVDGGGVGVGVGGVGAGSRLWKKGKADQTTGKSASVVSKRGGGVGKAKGRGRGRTRR